MDTNIQMFHMGIKIIPYSGGTEVTEIMITYTEYIYQHLIEDTGMNVN